MHPRGRILASGHHCQGAALMLDWTRETGERGWAETERSSQTGARRGDVFVPTPESENGYKVTPSNDSASARPSDRVCVWISQLLVRNKNT